MKKKSLAHDELSRSLFIFYFITIFVKIDGT